MALERNISGIFDEYGSSASHYHDDLEKIQEIESDKVRSDIGKIGIAGLLAMAVSAGLMLQGLLGGLLGGEFLSVMYGILWATGVGAAAYGGIRVLRKLFSKNLDLPSLSVMRKTVVQQQTPTAQYAQQTNMSYPQTQSRKSELRRSRANRVFAGVAGGLGEYFKVSPALIRFAFIVANFATGGTVLFVYLVLALVLPKNYDEWKRKK